MAREEPSLSPYVGRVPQNPTGNSELSLCGDQTLSQSEGDECQGEYPDLAESTSRQQVFLNVQAAACRTSPGDYKQESTRSRVKVN